MFWNSKKAEVPPAPWRVSCDEVAAAPEGYVRNDADQLPNRSGGIVEWDEKTHAELFSRVNVFWANDDKVGGYQEYVRLRRDGRRVHGVAVLEQLRQIGCLPISLGRDLFAWGDMFRAPDGAYMVRFLSLPISGRQKWKWYNFRFGKPASPEDEAEAADAHHRLILMS